MPRPSFLAPLTLALSFVVASAHAEPGGDAAAEAVFEQGLKKLEAGDYEAACPLLARAIELSSTEALGGMLTLADCYEKSRRPASAWGLYKRVAARAASTGESARADTARAAAARLEPTLPKLTFRAPPGAPADLVIVRGKERIPADVWNVPVPFDPGEVTLVFEAPGHAPAKKTITVPAGPSETAIDAPVMVASSGGVSPEDGATAPTRDGDREAQNGGGLGGVGIAGVVVGGLGVVSLAAGIGVGVAAKGKWDDAVTADCDGDPTRCARLDGIDSARAQGDVGSVLVGVGAGLAAVGLTLLIVDLATGDAPEGERAGAAPSTFALDVTPFGARATWRIQ